MTEAPESPVGGTGGLTRPVTGLDGVGATLGFVGNLLQLVADARLGHG